MVRNIAVAIDISIVSVQHFLHVEKSRLELLQKFALLDVLM